MSIVSFASLLSLYSMMERGTLKPARTQLLRMLKNKGKDEVLDVRHSTYTF